MIKDAIIEANEAAQQAAEAWLNAATSKGPSHVVMHGSRVVGSLLDLCGGAYIKFRDRRSKVYKEAKAAGFAYYEMVSITYPLRSRQEAGLHEAAIRAALGVLVKHYGEGKFSIHTYID